MKRVAFEALGGRRFLMTVATFATTSVMLWFGKLSDNAYADITMATTAAFIAGNVVQKHIERHGAPPAPACEDGPR